MIEFMYSGKESIVSSIQDLDLLFEVYRMADKVRGTVIVVLLKLSASFA